VSFVSELRRRNVVRMAVLYVVAAWLVVQVSESIITLAHLPAWVGPATLSLLALGFPFALSFSWFFEITPAGISREKDVAPDSSITHVTGRRLDFIVISLLSAAVILFAADKWWMQAPEDRSIAVLPFENMSADPEQEYFSDGISEELLNILAQIPELRVISRTSTFSFKGQNLEIREIAKRLNVAHVLEGSVRRSGNKLRITAQLIQARDGFHLWSNSYDRDVGDVFAIQDEIALAISNALKLTLSVGDETNREKSSEAYTAYLKGRYLFNMRTADSFQGAKEQFERAIEIDSDYALAYSGLADTYQLLAAYRYMSTTDARPLQRAAAYKALQLDESSAEAHVSVGAVLAIHDWDWKGAARELKRAIEINPNYALALQWYGSALAIIGDPGHLEMMQRAYAANPVSLRTNVDLGLAYYFNEEYETAISQLRSTLELAPDFLAANGVLGLALVETGEYEEAIAEIQKGAGGGLSLWLGYAYAKAGREDDAMTVLTSWQERWEESQHGAVEIALIHTGLGNIDSAFEWINKGIDARAPAATSLKSYPYWKALRTDPRYKELLRRLNL
jgi:adenylate cyclase